MYLRGFEDAARKVTYNQSLHEDVAQAVEILERAFIGGHRLYVVGNGGSAAMANHFAGELVSYFSDRGQKPLPAVSLAADTAILTSIANDSDFAFIFSRQIHAYGQEGDVLVALSTSGESLDVLNALRLAGQAGMKRIALVGQRRCTIDEHELADVVIHVPATETAHIQEGHLALLHVICHCLDHLR
jgi:D-sedoheptulose 7-phosphate isomerase